MLKSKINQNKSRKSNGIRMVTPNTVQHQLKRRKKQGKVKKTDSYICSTIDKTNSIANTISHSITPNAIATRL